MARVIQDSDDELDDELISEEHQAASPKHSTGNTSSTEALRKQIEAAHQAHLQSQFVLHDVQTPTSVKFCNNKADITVETETITDSTNVVQPPCIPDGVALTDYLQSLSSTQQHRRHHGIVDHFSQPAETTPGVEWTLDGSLREAYAHHDPNFMFPEPSSTIPNATYTQQRMMEGLGVPALPGSNREIEKVSLEPVASIPWSEYLKSPTTTMEHPISSIREPHILQTTSPTHSQHSSLSIPTQSTRQCHKAINSSPISTSDDDLAHLEIPKERYKPRPTRSRSLKVDTTELVDYSIRLETATKARKRVKSTPTIASLPDFHSTQAPLSTPNRVRQICEMGFTPSTSTRAPQKNNGDLTQTVDWLIANRIGDDELTSQTSQKSGAARMQPAASIDTPVLDNELQERDLDCTQKMAIDVDASPDAAEFHTAVARKGIATSVVDHRSPSKVQVVIPAKLPVSSDKHTQKGTKRRKTASDQPEPVFTADEVRPTKAENKRGRGRPEKVSEDFVSTSSMQQNEDEGPKKQAGDYELFSAESTQRAPVQDQEDLKTTCTNSTYSKPDLKSLGSGNTSFAKETTPEPTILSDRPHVEPITPEHVNKVAPREQFSSTRAKMNYRVGLSKRARIAPLLRTMRK